MKNIKVLILVGLLPFLTLAQIEVRDDKLNVEKGLIFASVSGLAVAKALIWRSYDALEVEEKKYRDKLNDAIDITSIIAYGGVRSGIVRLQDKIAELETKITILEATPPFIHRGLKQIKGDLARERQYLSKVWDDIDGISILTLSPRLTGGAGYTYTYVLKLALRFNKIRSQVLKIEYNLSNLNVFTRAFY